MTVYTKLTRRASVLVLLSLALSACSPNPNAAGVTDTGTVTGRLVNARQPTQPIQQAIISIGVQTYRLSPSDSGGFTIPNVPTGTQTLSITSTGFDPVQLQIVVRKDQTTDIGSPTTPGGASVPYGLAPTGPGQ